MWAPFGTWCQTTTCHGFGHLAHATQNAARILWCILITICAVGLCLELGLVLHDFASNESYTSTVSERPRHHSTMPEIVICNYNRIKTSAAKTEQFSAEMIDYFLSNFWVYYDVRKNPTNESEEAYKTWRKAKGYNFTDILEKMSHTCEETFLFFQSAPLMKSFPESADMSPCNATIERNGFQVRPIYTAEFGKCYMIDFGNGTKAKFTGNFGSSSIVLHAHVDDYLHSIYNNFHDVGFAVQFAIGQKISTGQWLRVQPGRHSWIGVQHREDVLVESSGIKLFAPPCAKNPKMPGMPDEYYDMAACQVDCFYAQVAKLCECYPLVKTPKYERICEVEEFAECMEAYKIINDTQKLVESCQNECLTPCYHQSFETSISTTVYPSANQEKELRTYLEGFGHQINDIQANVAAIELYYTTLASKYVQTFERMTFDQLLSGIGGQLGLWMGISVLTVQHLVISLINCCYDGKQTKTTSAKKPDFLYQ